MNGPWRCCSGAQLAPPLELVPPVAYGGTERVIHTLTEELVRRGHDVTLFASGDSETSARLVPTCAQAVWHHQPPYHDFMPAWSVVLGKAISPKLFVSYGISIAEAINTIKLRYTLNNRWAVKAESGLDQSADIEYKIER